jgi:nucleotide-binding universal stress UspA family protein
VFPTNFSHSCFRTIPAMAQWLDQPNSRLTLLHVYNPATTTRRCAESSLASFFAEAEHYGNCERILLEGGALESILSYCDANEPDLIVMPVSDRVGLPRFGHKSMRARILRHSRTPMWTVGRRIESESFSSPVRNVACWVNYDSTNLSHLREACSLALKLDATLQLIHVVPRVDEGTLVSVLDGYQPLHPKVAEERLNEMGVFLPVKTEVHVAVGATLTELPKLLKKCGADLMFAGEKQVLKQGWFSPKLNPVIEICPCPVVCLDGGSANRGIGSRHEWWPSAQPEAAKAMTTAALSQLLPG